MKIYDVCYNWLDYDYEHTTVYCESKRQIPKIMRDQFGEGVEIVYIELIDE